VATPAVPERLLTFLALAGLDLRPVPPADPSTAAETGVLAVAAAPGPFAGLAGVTAVVVPAGDAPEGPRVALAGAGVLPIAVRQSLDRIAELSRRTRPLEPVGEDVGRLLYLLVRLIRPRRVLEVGTGAGAAALWLAVTLRRPGGHLVTIERDSARWTMAQRHVREAGLADLVDLRLGEAERVLPRLEGRFDLVFLDEAPEDRAGHLEVLLPRLASGALVVSHGGLRQPAALARVNALLATHPAIAAHYSLAAGDGLALAVAVKAPASRAPAPGTARR
jgi:predicted O-methyltransferase YrrM